MGLTVSDIPADVIVAIIGGLKEEAYQRANFPCKVIYGTSFAFSHLSLEWLNSTQFCRTWRLAALNCPSLWADISVSNWDDKVITEFLVRSQDSTLRLVMNLPIYDESSYALKHNIHRAVEMKGSIPNRYLRCLENLHRTRSLDVCLAGRAAWCRDVLDILQSTEMPALEHFALDGYLLRFIGSTTFNEVPFANCTPRLRSVALRSAILPGNSSILRPSEHLSLEHVVCHGSQTLDSILSSCSALTRLRLDSVKVVNDGTYTPMGNQPIILPNIQSITICGSTDFCNHLQSICRYPTGARSNIAYAFLDESDTVPAFPARYLSGHVWACFQVRPKSLMEIRWDTKESCESRGSSYGFGMQKSAETLFQFTSGCLWSFDSLIKIFEETDHSIEELTLYADTDENNEDLRPYWKRLFLSIPNLRRLTIRFRTKIDPSFCGMLIDQKSTNTHVFPELTDLVVIFDSFISSFIDELKSGLAAWRARSRQERFHLCLLTSMEGYWFNMDVAREELREVVGDCKILRMRDSELDSIVDPDDFWVYRRLRRYGRKTEFRR